MCERIGGGGFQNFSRIENWTIIKEVTGFQRLAIFQLLLATEVMWKL